MADNERIGRIISEIRAAQLDAVICALPMNVLMLSGYWPVVGTAAAMCTRDGEIWIAAPEAEHEFAAAAQPHRLELFSPGSLTELDRLTIREPLRKLLTTRTPWRVGVETASSTVPVAYSALHIYASDLRDLLATDLGHSTVPADPLLRHLRAVKTPREIQLIRAACTVAEKSFQCAQKAIAPGMTELDIALKARHEFALPAANQEHHRADGFAWCMSGPNSADAGAAFARSQSRRIEANDVVLLHANSYLDGYWTDITRTFTPGEPPPEVPKLTSVIMQARQAALDVISPGAKAADVDRAARDVIARHGFGDYFSHGLGHEVGFGAINANDLPRIHPASPDVLETGMVFNIEPAMYLPERFGIRHCDLVVVTGRGAEVLTPWLPAA